MSPKRLVTGWIVAATVALAFSWGAVGQVRNRVIEPAVQIPATVPSVIAADTTQPTVVQLDLDTPQSDESESTVPTAAPAESTEELPSTTVPETTVPPNESPSTTTAAPPVTTTTTTTTTTPPTTTTAPPPTTTTTSAPQLTTTSHTLQGGVVTISHSPGLVNFVAAIPQPGFTTDQRETGPDEVRIRFESPDHTSDFRARWEGGELRITESETGDDD